MIQRREDSRPQPRLEAPRACISLRDLRCLMDVKFIRNASRLWACFKSAGHRKIEKGKASQIEEVVWCGLKKPTEYKFVCHTDRARVTKFMSPSLPLPLSHISFGPRRNRRLVLASSRLPWIARCAIRSLKLAKARGRANLSLPHGRNVQSSIITALDESTETWIRPNPTEMDRKIWKNSPKSAHIFTFREFPSFWLYINLRAFPVIERQLLALVSWAWLDLPPIGGASCCFLHLSQQLNSESGPQMVTWEKVRSHKKSGM